MCLLKVISKFCFAFLKVTDEIAGFGAGSGSVIQRYGSADPDLWPYLNVTDPQHCFEPFF